MALTPKQKVFVAEYLVDKNATRAAKAAGYAVKAAAQAGYELLTKPQVRAEIEKGIKKQQQRAIVRAAKRGLTKERWLEEVQMIALANMDDFATIEKVKQKNGDEGEVFTVTSVNPATTKERPREFGRAIKKLSETKNGIGIELHSKQAALEILGRHYGWLDSKSSEPPANAGFTVNLTMPSNGREAKEDKK